MHPSTESLLRFFEYEHLPAKLQEISQPFHALAWGTAERLATSPAPAEVTTALRKLLEAKDCAVRAALPAAPAYPLVPQDDPKTLHNEGPPSRSVL